MRRRTNSKLFRVLPLIHDCDGEKRERAADADADAGETNFSNNTRIPPSTYFFLIQLHQ